MEESKSFIPPSPNEKLHNKSAKYYESRGLLSNKELVDKVLQFCIILSCKNWYTYQKAFAKRIIESVVLNEGETITGLLSRQSGKTETIANVAIGLAIILPALANDVFPDDERLAVFKEGFWVGIFAPIQEQADISHLRIRTLVDREETELILKECGAKVVTNRGGNVTLDNNSYIHSRSASPDSKVEGKTYHLIIIEEAQLVSRYKVNKEISPMMAAVNGTLVKIGTAHLSKGGFHNSIQFNIAVYKNGGKRNHFEFPYKLIIKEKENAYKKDGNMFHLQYERWLNNQIAKLGGTDNEEFQMNFELKWKESKKIAINEDKFTSLGNPNLEINQFTKEGYQVAGLDIAKEGDQTVCTVLSVNKESPILIDSIFGKEDGASVAYSYSKKILGWLALQGSFEGDDGQYYALVNYLRKWNVSVLVADATGMGDPVTERLMLLLPEITIIPFKYSLQSKSALYKYYIPEINSGRLEYPAGPKTKETKQFQDFQKQHINLDRQYSGEYLVVEGAEGEHDDYPNSVALATWASKSELVPTIEVESTKKKGFSELSKWRKLGSAPGRMQRYSRRW